MSSLLSKLLSGQFVTTVEVNPPASHDAKTALDEVGELLTCCASLDYARNDNIIDAIDITNCAFSRVRLSPIALGKLIQDRFGIETIVNYTCRDRNVIAAKSDLLGALALGISNVLCMTGDDPKIGDHPEATGVFDLDTGSLISVCKTLQSGGSRFAVGAAAAASEDDLSLQKLEAKRKAGADFFITQPLYTVAEVEVVARLQAKLGKPFIVGVLPFKNYRMAETLAKVPGINVPAELLQSLKLKDEAEFAAESVTALLPVVARAREIASGLHLMPIGEIGKVPRLLSAVAGGCQVVVSDSG